MNQRENSPRMRMVTPLKMAPIYVMTHMTAASWREQTNKWLKPSENKQTNSESDFLGKTQTVIKSIQSSFVRRGVKYCSCHWINNNKSLTKLRSYKGVVFFFIPQCVYIYTYIYCNLFFSAFKEKKQDYNMEPIFNMWFLSDTTNYGHPSKLNKYPAVAQYKHIHHFCK